MAISKLNSGIYNHKEIPVTYEIVLNSGGIIYKMYKPSEMQKILQERSKNPNGGRYKSWKSVTEEGEIDRSKIMRAPRKLNKPQEKRRNREYDFFRG